MADNFIQDGKNMVMPTADGAETGDAFVVGNYLPCVLLTDAGADPYNATVKTEGVFDLSAKAHDGSSNSAISIGDMLYWTDKDTELDKDTSQDPFGVALEAVTSGETDTIKVLLVPKSATPSAVKPQSIADPGDAGAIPVTVSGVCAITTEGAETRTLAIPTFVGQMLTLTLDVDGGDAVVTVAAGVNVTGNNTLTFDNAGETIPLIGTQVAGALVWRIIANDGVGLSTV